MITGIVVAPEDEKPDDEDPTPEERARMPVGRPHGRKQWEPILIKFLPEQRRRIEAAARLVAKQMSPFVRDATMTAVKHVEDEAREARRQQVEEREWRRRAKADIPAWAQFGVSPQNQNPQAAPPISPAAPGAATQQSVAEQMLGYIMSKPEAQRQEIAAAALKLTEEISPAEAVRLRNALEALSKEQKEPWWRALVPKP